MKLSKLSTYLQKSHPQHQCSVRYHFVSYLSTCRAISVILTQGAVLWCQQQMALTVSFAFNHFCLRTVFRVWAVSQQAAGQRRTPATRLVRQAGQAGHVTQAGTRTVRLQEQEGNLLEGKEMWFLIYLTIMKFVEFFCIEIYKESKHNLFYSYRFYNITAP